MLGNGIVQLCKKVVSVIDTSAGTITHGTLRLHKNRWGVFAIDPVREGKLIALFHPSDVKIVRVDEAQIEVEGVFK